MSISDPESFARISVNTLSVRLDGLRSRLQFVLFAESLRNIDKEYVMNINSFHKLNFIQKMFKINYHPGFMEYVKYISTSSGDWFTKISMLVSKNYWDTDLYHLELMAKNSEQYVLINTNALARLVTAEHNAKDFEESVKTVNEFTQREPEATAIIKKWCY